MLTRTLPVILAAALVAGCAGAPGSPGADATRPVTITVVNEDPVAHTLTATAAVDADVVDEARTGVQGNGTATITLSAPSSGNVRFELATNAVDGAAGVTLAVASCQEIVLTAAVTEGSPRFTETRCA